MKIIFLDIDGVLNSFAYDRIRKMSEGNIDESRMVLLKEITDQTEGRVVLTSSWRIHFDKDFEKCDNIGKEIYRTFEKWGITIYDKTPLGFCRGDEIKSWLDCNNDVESFVIIDDMVYGWGELQSRLVLTNARIGRGLEEYHKNLAIQILNGR